MSDFYAGPTRTYMNPSAPESAEFYDPTLTMHVIQRVDEFGASPSFRAYTSSGSIMEVGEEGEFIHGWAGLIPMGWWRCVSTLHPDGRLEGEALPDRKLPHWVAK